MDLSQLKKSRKEKLATLQKKLEENKGGTNYTKDERIWKPKFNKEKGKGTCIVRFLQPKAGDPMVELKTNSFKVNGKNFWENARQTLDLEDPLQIAAISCFQKAKQCEDKTEAERFKKEGKLYLPGSKYWANVLIIKDEECPENEGKVMIYEFGRQIFLMIESKLQPKFEDDEVMNPFDYWEGANFKIRMVGKDIPDQQNPGKNVTVPNYEESSFMNPSELFDGDDDQIDEVYQQTHDLSEFVDISKFKSFDDLATKFLEVTGKPYNWLSQEGLKSHAVKTEADLKEAAAQDFEKEEPVQESQPSADEMPFDTDDSPDDIVARFRALTQGN